MERIALVQEWARYRGAAAPLKNLSMACVGAGEQEGALKTFSGRTLDTHALVVISRGKGRFQSRGKSHRVHGPALIWIFPGVQHGYGPDADGWAEHWILFTGTAARAYQEMGCFSPEHPVVALDSRVPVEAFSELRDAMDLEGPRGELAASVLAQQIIVDAGSRGRNLEEKGAQAIVSRLREIACLPLSVAQQAELLGHTPSSLREVVAKVAGTGAKDLVLQVRLSRAQALLAESEHPVARIARMVGYGDSAYFSRLFARKVGQSPSDFRAMHKR